MIREYLISSNDYSVERIESCNEFVDKFNRMAKFDSYFGRIKENPKNGIITQILKFKNCTFYIKCDDYEDLEKLYDNIIERRYLYDK